MITVLLAVTIIGFLAYVLSELVPEPFKKIVIAVGILLIIWYLVQTFGLDFPIPRRHADSFIPTWEPR
jgi:hypothetical protein